MVLNVRCACRKLLRTLTAHNNEPYVRLSQSFLDVILHGDACSRPASAAAGSAAGDAKSAAASASGQHHQSPSSAAPQEVERLHATYWQRVLPSDLAQKFGGGLVWRGDLEQLQREASGGGGGSGAGGEAARSAFVAVLAEVTEMALPGKGLAVTAAVATEPDALLDEDGTELKRGLATAASADSKQEAKRAAVDRQSSLDTAAAVAAAESEALPPTLALHTLVSRQFSTVSSDGVTADEQPGSSSAGAGDFKLETASSASAPATDKHAPGAALDRQQQSRSQLQPLRCAGLSVKTKTVHMPRVLRFADEEAGLLAALTATQVCLRWLLHLFSRWN